MGAFDPHPYSTLLAEEINSMFTKIEQSSFVADFIWSCDTLLVCTDFFFKQYAIDMTLSLHK